MTSFRPLQPAPLDQKQQQQPQPQSRPLLTQKPKRTVTLGACVACRKRKSKCDGTRPVCTCCSQKDTECVYELGPNEKPSQAMKRKNEEMQGELSNLRQLYDFMRMKPEQEAQEILRRIRANPPGTTPFQRIQQLADFVRHSDLLIRHSSGPSSQHPSESLTLPPIRIALDLPGPNLCSLPPSLPFPHSILTIGREGPTSQRRRHASDADVSARSDSRGSFPPPTSIEAILHDHKSAIKLNSPDPKLGSAKHWTTATNDESLLSHLMSVWYTWEYTYFHFFDWNIFLDDMVTGRTEFCSKLLVNALLASACSLSPLIKDRSKPFSDNIMTSFYKEARRLWELEEGQDTLPKLQAALLLYLVLGKHGRDKVGHTFLIEACRIGRDLGLFRLLPSTSIQKPLGVPEAKWERARAVTAWALFNFQLSMAFTYSFPAVVKSQPPVSIPYDECPNSEALFRAECGRHVIMLSCADTLMDADCVDSDIPPKPEQVEVLYLRFKSWWDARLESLDPTRNPSLERVKSYQLRHLLKLQESCHGWSNTIPYVLHPIMVTSFGSLEEIALQNPPQSSPEFSEPYRGILTCLKALSALSNSVFYAQPLFRLLTQGCQTLGIPLPIEVMRTLGMFQTEEWTKNAASVVSSQYVADMRKTAAELENARMDAVIMQWDALTIGDKTGADPSRTVSRSMQEMKGD
ncbi:hypothetical protein K469DRAFT_555285 [Zopfia rhizophila CBS 207.26]|uniref:Zn(2)-C6 fungal-type domain-containing protein n=1 Tax=Zopfia rhizophila CBS 207.26 TaxID=1314779 RepID=A0A6A6EPD7_9PEZI|nr:hypothetical protein K469DRAFT_555285 [Zopfia rhizophila CBS 207.26]